MSQAIGKTGRRLRGMIAAMVTPLCAGRPNLVRAVSLARHLLDSGCDGLNLLGTTGEGTSFSVEERAAVMSALADANLPMHRLMVGTGAAACSDAIALSRHAASLGFGGALLLPPFYYKDVCDAGVAAYIRQVIEATANDPVPIYLYNYPALSGVTFTVALVSALLAEFGVRIVGLKDSSRDAAYAAQVAALSDSFDVFAVSAADIPATGNGAYAGIISGVANVNPREFCAANATGDEAMVGRVRSIERVFEGLPQIPAIKEILAEVHGAPSFADVRPPLVRLSETQTQVLRARYAAV